MKTNFKSLRFIMAISFIIIMLCIYSVTFFVLYNKFKDTNEVNMRNISAQISKQSETEINNYIIELADVCNYIVSQTFFHPENNNETLNTVISSRNDIATLTLFNEDGSVSASATQMQIKENTDISDQTWFLMALKTKKDTYFSEPHVQNLFVGKYPWVISLSQNANFYNPLDSNSKILLMDIPIKEFENKINSIKLGQRGYSYIIDKYGNIIYHPKQQLLNCNLLIEDIDFALNKVDGNYNVLKEEETYVSIRTFAKTGWKLVSVSYIADIMIPQNEITYFALITVIVGIIIIITVSWLISELVSRPVMKLEKSMELVEQGNFEATVDVRGDFEVERLSESYNKMVKRIKELIAQNITEQEEKRKSEMNALQMQIKPHFLYNTLESIIWMAEKGNNSEVIKMTSALAKLFRISLSSGKEIINVSDEILHVKSYLVIQKMRYEDKIDFVITVTKEAGSLYTLKLILQPIVENAIYHGLKELNEKGLIEINAYVAENKLIYRIKDNGVGMTKQCLERLFVKNNAYKNSSGVGVINVDERIKLYYGDEYGISIESDLDIGTTVTLCLPVVKEL